MTTPQTTRTGAIRQPLPAARARAAFDPRKVARARRRRLLLRFVPFVVIASLLIFGLSRAIGPSHPKPPSQVASDIHDDVARTIVDRTDDYTATVGPLDCVELQPGKGNCLANVKLAGHHSDHVMVAVTYTQTGGDYDLLVKMP